MRILYTLTSLVCLVGIAGCGGGTTYIYEDDTPELQGFYVIDSDNYSSEFAQDEPMIIDPFTNEGLFEVYWYASSYYDYNVYLSINNRPGLDGAKYIIGERCGLDYHCDTDGLYLCQYTAYSEFACGLDTEEIENNYVNIAEFTGADDIPDSLFLNFEVCDLDDFYCEIQTIPVQMY